MELHAQSSTDNLGVQVFYAAETPEVLAPWVVRLINSDSCGREHTFGMKAGNDVPGKIATVRSIGASECLAIIGNRHSLQE